MARWRPNPPVHEGGTLWGHGVITEVLVQYGGVPVKGRRDVNVDVQGEQQVQGRRPTAADGAWKDPLSPPGGAADAAAALQAPEPRAPLPASGPPTRGTASPAPEHMALPPCPTKTRAGAGGWRPPTVGPQSGLSVGTRSRETLLREDTGTQGRGGAGTCGRNHGVPFTRRQSPAPPGFGLVWCHVQTREWERDGLGWDLTTALACDLSALGRL